MMRVDSGAPLRRVMRNVPGARRGWQMARAAWQRVRPFPTPRYAAETPRIGRHKDPYDPFLPPTALTLAEAAMSEDAARFVLSVLDKLQPAGEAGSRYFYIASREKFGRYWRYADLLTMLWAAATFLRPRAYLEIGVCRGRSAAVVGALVPACAIYGFDLWGGDYAGAANPGPDFVRGELRAAGHVGDVVLIEGDSRQTLPAFLRQHPDLFFDLVTIDGDKSVAGCATDMANALSRLKIGGVLVFDDLPAVPALERVWDRVVRRDRRYASWEYQNGHFGVAVAVRLA